MGAGMIVSMARPITGQVMITRAERTADALITVATKNPAFMKVLIGFTTASAYAALFMVLSEHAVAVMVEMGRLPADSMIAKPIEDVLAPYIEQARQHHDAVPEPVAA